MIREWLKTNSDILTILAAAFIIRMSLIGWLHDVVGYTGDEREYLVLATRLAEGGPFLDSNNEWATRAPLYPFLISLCFRAFGTNLLIPHFLNVVFGIAAVFLIFHLCLRVCRERSTARMAAALSALYPGLVIYSDILQTEALYLVLFLLVLIIMVALLARPRLRTGVLLGLIAGLACLTRAAFFGFFPLLLIAAVWWYRERLPVLWKPLLVAGVVWMFVLAPWTWRNYEILGSFVPISSGGGMSLLLGNNPHATGTWKPSPAFRDWFEGQAREHGLDLANSTEMQRGALAQSLAWDFVVSEPLHALSIALKKLYIHSMYPITNTDSEVRIQAIAVLFDVFVYLLAGIGFIAGRAATCQWRLIFAAIAFFTVQQVVLYAEARFRLPVMPLILLLSAGGLMLLSDTERRHDVFHNQHKLKLALAWCVVLGGAYAFMAWQFLTGQL